MRGIVAAGQADASRKVVDAFSAAAKDAGAGGLIWEQTLRDWEWVVGVNLMGVAHGVRVFTPMMLAAAEAERLKAEDEARKAAEATAAAVAAEAEKAKAEAAAQPAAQDLIPKMGGQLLDRGLGMERFHEGNLKPIR